jgi:uridine kinase
VNGRPSACRREEQEVISRFTDLAEAIRRAPARCGSVRLVAIDGPGGAGKSVFAERLARHLGGALVIHTDDFASWDNPVEWWGRLEDEVLGPVERGEWPVRFRAYDWVARRLGEWREIPPSDVILLEGVSSSRQAVAKRLSLAVWIEAPLDRRLARGLERDGAAMRAQWEQWMAEEHAHFAEDRARDRADVIVDGAPSMPHDPEEEFVRLDQS